MAKPIALHILHDSGAPAGSTDYTTIFILHGFAWHSGIFAKLLPIAPTHNARVVLVNRRDYPGATTYTPEERAVLQAAISAAGTESDRLGVQRQLQAFMKARAREVYDLLVRFVVDNNPPPARSEENAGGIVIAGWSFGAAWMVALLANVAEFGVNDVELGRYVRRVVFYDPTYRVFGFRPPVDAYNPLTDTTLSPGESTRVFTNWVSGYYTHGDSPDQLERRTHLASPPPTLSTLTDEDRAAGLYPEPTIPGGSDSSLLFGGSQLGLYSLLRDRAIFLPKAKDGESGEDEEKEVTDAWGAVEVRYVWCDQSVWEIPWGVWKMREELRKAREAGIESVRDVTFLRIRGANHFVHWDEPVVALKAFLADISDDSE